jgi:hypothetical protein
MPLACKRAAEPRLQPILARKNNNRFLKLIIMEIKILCQSCGIPLDNEAIKGTEKNGLKSDEFCKFCYDKGAFTNPNLTLAEMQENIEAQIKKLMLSEDVIKEALSILPILNRWKTN